MTRNCKPRPLHDRLQTFRYEVTRNRAAAAVAFVSGISFLSSGYKANVEICNHVSNQTIAVDGLSDFWQYLIAPIGVLALLAQLELLSCLERDFWLQKVNVSKFLVIVGTGQGLFTIAICILSEIWTGQTWATDNYITWLTSSAAGLAILFAVLSQSISKGKGQILSVKAFRFALRR